MLALTERAELKPIQDKTITLKEVIVFPIVAPVESATPVDEPEAVTPTRKLTIKEELALLPDLNKDLITQDIPDTPAKRVIKSSHSLIFSNGNPYELYFPGVVRTKKQKEK